MRRPLMALALGALTFLGACATSGVNGMMASSTVPGANGFHETRMTRTGRSLVSAPELVSTKAQDVYQALLQIRPEFLRGRGAASINLREQTQVVVYFDNVRAGGIEALRGFPLAGITSIQFLKASDATQRWGTGHSGGVILINTMR